MSKFSSEHRDTADNKLRPMGHGKCALSRVVSVDQNWNYIGFLMRHVLRMVKPETLGGVLWIVDLRFAAGFTGGDETQERALSYGRAL